MAANKLYSIGEVSKLCNISTKALRFYDKIGVIAPDEVGENGYRYYTLDTILRIPILKYYKQMGFRLEEMQGLVGGNGYYFLKQNFLDKIDELKELEQSIHNSFVSVKEWYELIREAQMVVQNPEQEISVKYIQPVECCYLEQDFSYRYMDSIINIDWVNYLESVENEISGPVILKFPSYEDKMNGTCTRAGILQKAVRPFAPGTGRTVYGGIMAASVYHVGPFETIGEEYGRIRDWAASRGYVCGPECYERYVVDYWTTRDPVEFVTEVVVPIAREEKRTGEESRPSKLPLRGKPFRPENGEMLRMAP